MKNFLRLISVLFLYGVLVTSTQAQHQQKIDSLMVVLKLTKKDTSKVNLLNDLAWEQMYSNPDTAILIGKKALSLAIKSGWEKGISICLGNLGTYYLLKGNYLISLDYNLKSLKIAEEQGDKKGVSVELDNIGLVYFRQGNYLKALDYHFKSLVIAEELGNKVEIALVINNIGNVYSAKGDYRKALGYFLKALKISKELGDKDGTALNLSNLGLVYDCEGNYPKALAHYFKALKIAEELGNKQLEINNIGNIGSVYAKQKDYHNALNYLLKAIKLEQEVGDEYNLAISLGNIGSLFTLTGKFKEAELNIKKAITIAESLDAKNESRQFEESLSQLYDTTGRYQLALIHYKKSMALKDTLFNEEKENEITRKEMNYEFDKKEIATKAEHDKEIAVAAVEIKRQKLIKNFFIGGLALLLVLFYFIYNNFKTVSKLKLQNIRNKIASDLHDDVGSTLNSISIYSEVAKLKAPTAMDELEQIGDASRKIIEVMSDIVWTINPNNDSFENIISRMSTLAYNLLKAKNIEHLFQAEESLNEMKLSLETRRNFYLIFKEALNNLVKYSQATRASITLTHENGLITLTLRDNGIGFDVAQTSKGNGLLNMKARAKEMKAQLKIESNKENGTFIQLTLKG